MKNFKTISLLLMAIVSLFAFTACGDDDNEDNNKNKQTEGQPLVGDITGTWETVSLTTEDGKEIIVNSTNPEVYHLWNRFVFGANGSFDGYSVNYNGDEGLRGRIEHTMKGKYVFDAKLKTMNIYDFVEGYHNVLNYDSEKKTTIKVEVLSLSNNEFTAKYERNGQNMILKMRKNQTQPLDKSLISGTWKTIRIVGSATSVSTREVVESWNNTPSLEDANDPQKESLKYMEFTFDDKGNMKIQQFDEEKRTFTEIMEGTWVLNGNTVIANMMGIEKSVEIVELTSDKLTIHMNYIDKEFRIHETHDKIEAIYDETIYFTRK